MNGFVDGTVGIQDWQNGSSIGAPPSTIVDDAGIPESIDDIKWFLAQLPSQTEAKDDVGWEDIAGPTSFEAIRMERRSSQASLWDGSTRSACGSKSRGTKRRRLPDTAADSHSIPYQARQKALMQIASHGRKQGNLLAEMENFACEEKHCYAMEPMGEDARDYSGGERC